VHVSVQLPAGYRSLGDARDLMLERLRSHEGGALPLVFHARFASLVRQYAVLVNVGRPNLPIDLFGVQKSTTNSLGAALLVTSGAPGDALDDRVRAERPGVDPPFVAKTFNLPDQSEVFTMTGRFTVRPKARRPKPPILRPTRLTTLEPIVHKEEHR
jgi:hypothetical protein